MNSGSLLVEKPWGQEIIVEHNTSYVVKLITFKNGHRTSLQYHHHKIETVQVLSGELKVELKGGIFITYLPGDNFTLQPMETHRMSSAGSFDTLILECSTDHLDDIVRVDDDYGRADI